MTQYLAQESAAAPFEAAAMRRAVQLAALGPARGPNPRVGCVVLDAAGTVAGEGFHAGAGTPHAEVVALAQAGVRARRGTAVVTLEPCDHTGRTGPCTRALLDAGIIRVVIGALDPNPVAAGGAGALRHAGVEVETGLSAADCEALNLRWAFAVRSRRPWVTWKLAASLDGRSAAADGTSRWITGAPARADVHRRRAQHDAVVVGTGTVLADDPALTVRDAAGDLLADQPLRVVVGRRALPPGARVLSGPVPALRVPTHEPSEALAALHELEVRSVWLEGGPTLAAAFWRAGLVDEVLAYLAPALLGAGRAAVDDLGIATMADIARLRLTGVTEIGEDVLITAVPAPP